MDALAAVGWIEVGTLPLKLSRIQGERGWVPSGI
jgi:hypothetical protein